MQARRDGDGVVATVTLGTAFEGAPGRSHGGVVASATATFIQIDPATFTREGEGCTTATR